MRAWSEKRQISRTFLAGDGFHRAAATVYVQYSTKGLVENLERQDTHRLIRILDPYPRAGSSAACTKSLELTSEKKVQELSHEPEANRSHFAQAADLGKLLATIRKPSATKQPPVDIS